MLFKLISVAKCYRKINDDIVYFANYGILLFGILTKNFGEMLGPDLDSYTVQ